MKDFNEIETTKENEVTKMSMKEKVKKGWKTIVEGWKVIAISLIVGIAIGTYAGYNVCNFLNRTEVTNDYISGKLEDIGELATQQVTYSSTQQMEDGSIPFITKKSFLMHYSATLKAGIQMDEMDIKSTKKEVIVIIPHAEILGKPQVDPDSIKFMDEKRALFNWQTKEDAKKAISLAEKDIENNDDIDTSSLLEKADEHAKELIYKVLDGSVNGLKVVVRFK